MKMVDLSVTCPYCGNRFQLQLEEHADEDDLLDECPLCGNGIDLRLVLDSEGQVVDAEAHRNDGDVDI